MDVTSTVYLILPLLLQGPCLEVLRLLSLVFKSN